MNPPYLILDFAAYYANPDYGKMLEHPNICGVILKASEGTSYHPQWFVDNWRRSREAAGSRYGDTWFRGAYHFLRRGDGAAQADVFVDQIEAGGGFGGGDMMSWLDVEGEMGGADAREVIDTVTAFSARYKKRTGRKLGLYARGIMRRLGIQSRMGCDAFWDASYTAEIVTNGIFPAFSFDEIVLWQYRGKNKYNQTEGDNSIHGLPMELGMDPIDISVVVDGTRKPNLVSTRRRLGVTSIPYLVLALLAAAAFAITRTLA
jgi:GH25 family lysozyme M1 (1,4-beta-N-acetylmuramidase)